MKNKITNIMDPYYHCADGLAILLKVQSELIMMYNSTNSAKAWSAIEERIITELSDDEWFIISGLLFNDDMTNEEFYTEFFETGYYTGIESFICSPDPILEKIFKVVTK